MIKSRTSLRKTKINIYDILICLCVAIILVVASIFFYFFKQSNKNEDLVAEIKEKIIEEETIPEEKQQSYLEYYLIDGVPIQKKFKDIYLQNSDFIGWITIDDTVIDYPVMQTIDDEEYYLRRDFNKEYNVGGTLFIDKESSYKMPSDNIIMYGHHMHNGTMFKGLLKYEDEDYYKEHKYITFNTLNGNATYEIIAAYRTHISSEESTEFKYYEFHNAFSTEEYNDFISNSKNLTPYKIETDAEWGDKLLTLSTCAYHTSNGRYVVVAKRIEHTDIDTTQKPLEIITTENE